MSTSFGKVLRLAYAFGAVAYSVLGLIEFGLYASALPAITTASWQVKLLLSFVITRLALAIVQIPAHGSVLFSMRYYEEPAVTNIKQLGGGDLHTGIEKYYTYVNYCNVGLSIFIVFGLITLSITWTYGITGLVFHVLELISLSIFTIILAVRIYAAYTGTVREIFTLALPPTNPPHTTVSA